MIEIIPRLRSAVGLVLIAGAAALVGCAPTPVSTTTTTTEESVTTPPPMVMPSSTTTTTTEQVHRP
jgi:type IV pilus biogenesis protein CpaD/CtpE